MESLEDIAKALVSPGKGILAADESTPSIKKRFDAIGVESNPENNRLYRQLLFTTNGIEEYISGVILYDETIRQSTDDGAPFSKLLSEKGIIPGIKVDKGTVDLEKFPGEKVTEGLDGLKQRLEEYKNLGAKFTKWRAVINIGEGIPTHVSIGLNVEALARFAAISQEVGLVPIVEPEVLMDGDHSINKCREVTYTTLKTLFPELVEHKINLKAMLLKPNMVLPGKDSSEKPSSDEIAKATLECFKDVIPDDVPGIVFLSGGQTPVAATQNLNSLNVINNNPWRLSFSFGRALQEPVLAAWQGKNENIGNAQKEFLKRAKLNSFATKGEYKSEMEEDGK